MPWELSKYDATLTEAEYSTQRQEGKMGEIIVTAKGQIEAKFLSDLQYQMKSLALKEEWSLIYLVEWLDRTIPHRDIAPDESTGFLKNMVHNLIYDRGLTLEELVLDKYRLRQAAILKIDQCRQQAKKSGYHSLLFPDCATPLIVSPERCFTYDPANYPCNTYYQGAYRFQNHYYPQIGDLKNKGEEFQCAQFLDMLPEVNFWVRNLERRPSHAFWLQTSTDKFYPDFVCLLNDGRYLVVEYKGEDRWSDDDSKEKREIGEIWERRSNGQCLFIMPKGKDFDAIRAKIKS